VSNVGRSMGLSLQTTRVLLSPLEWQASVLYAYDPACFLAPFVLRYIYSGYKMGKALSFTPNILW